MRRFSLCVVAVWVAACSSSVRPGNPVAPSVRPSLEPISRVLSVPQLVQPEEIARQQFLGQLDRAITKAFRAPELHGLRVQSAVGDLVVVPISTRPEGEYIFPDPSGNQVTVPADVSIATFVVNLSLTDKLAVGKTFAWEFWFSADNGQTWTFRNGGGFTSFGPGGFTDFLGNVNPDPVLRLRVIDKRGQLIRGVLRLPQALDVGVTISTS